MNSTVTNQTIILLCLSKFCNHRGKIYSEKHQWMLKILGTSLMRNRIFTYLAPHRLLTNYKEKNSPLHRNLANTTFMFLLDTMPWDGHIGFLVFLQKMHNLILIMKKIADKFELRDILHNNWFTHFQSVKITEEDKEIAPVRRLKWYDNSYGLSCIPPKKIPWSPNPRPHTSKCNLIWREGL